MEVWSEGKAVKSIVASRCGGGWGLRLHISHAAPVERRTIQMHASFAQQHNIFYTDLMLSKADNLDAQGFTDVEHDSKPAHPKTRLPHPSTLQYQF